MTCWETVRTRPPAAGLVTVQVRDESTQVPSVTAGRVPSLVFWVEHWTPVVSMVPGWMTVKE